MKRLLKLVAILALVVPAMVAMTVVAQPYGVDGKRLLIELNCDGSYRVHTMGYCRR